ncbi:hypothetical protein KC367_g24 [Hortaea werneckii]|nr:hypothetical protein KC367_g24 [Hortaea werneckii]
MSVPVRSILTLRMSTYHTTASVLMGETELTWVSSSNGRSDAALRHSSRTARKTAVLSLYDSRASSRPL